MFATQSILVWLLRLLGRAKKHLTRYQPSIARPSQLPKNLSHHDFRLTGCVPLGVVEEINPSFVRLNHQIFGHIIGNLITERDPRTQREFAYFYSCFS